MDIIITENIKNYKYEQYVNIILKLVKNKFYSKTRPGVKLVNNINNLDNKLKIIINGILCNIDNNMPWKQFKVNGINGLSIYKHFRKWSSHSIFKDSYKQILEEYYLSKYCRNNKNITHMIIDCSLIKSIYGVVCIGANPTDRGRNANKISVIVDKNNIPLSFILVEGNISDTNLAIDTYKNIINKKTNNQLLYGDKGYSAYKLKLKLKKEFEQINVKLVCENKRNFKRKILKKNDIDRLMKHRYKIESIFGWLKHKKKIRCRYEKRIKYFKSVICIGLCQIISTKLYNMDH